MDSVRNVLETIRGCANEHLQNLDRRDDSWVELTSIVDHDGALNSDARDKIVMCLYNIRRETVISSYQAVPPVAASAGGPVGASAGLPVVNPPLYIDLHVIFMANFPEKNYPVGLAALSRLIGYFQQNSAFSQANAPNLAPDIPLILLEFENLGPVDVNFVMGMLGTRYFPSVFYKLRMLTFASGAMQARAYPVSGGGIAKR